MRDLEVCLEPVDLSEGGGGGTPLWPVRSVCVCVYVCVCVCVEILGVSRGVWEWRCVQLNPHMT